MSGTGGDAHAFQIVASIFVDWLYVNRRVCYDCSSEGIKGQARNQLRGTNYLGLGCYFVWDWTNGPLRYKLFIPQWTGPPGQRRGRRARSAYTLRYLSGRTPSTDAENEFQSVTA